jgi:hypothetical protein
MPVICLVQHYIKLILLMVVCLVLLKDSQSSAALSDVVQLKRWPCSGLPGVLVSCLCQQRLEVLVLAFSVVELIIVSSKEL